MAFTGARRTAGIVEMIDARLTQSNYIQALLVLLEQLIQVSGNGYTDGSTDASSWNADGDGT